MFYKKQTRYIPRLIIVGLLLHLHPTQEVKCEVATLTSAAMLATYMPVFASYATVIVAACLAKTQSWSKAMDSIAQEMQQRLSLPSIDTDHKQVVSLPTVAPAESKSMPQMQEHDHQPVMTPKIVAISQQLVTQCRVGLRNASHALCASIGQLVRDSWQKMSKPQNFQMQTVPGGIRITHVETGLSFQANMQSAATTQQNSAVNWESVIAQLPEVQAQAMKICAYIDEGNIEAAAQIAQLSDVAAIKKLYAERVGYLFATWSDDPLVRSLPAQVKNELMQSSHSLAEFFDCVLAREMIKSALCKAWYIKCNAPRIVKDAVYALCDTTQEGQLYCTPELINQRLDDIISKAAVNDQAVLVDAFYLPNGILKDFAAHTVVQALNMPIAILGSDNIKARKILNDLVVAHITARSQAEQLVTARGITNVKYAFSYPVPQKMKEVLLKSAELVCKSLEHQAGGFVHAYMLKAEHYKDLAKPIQVAAQTEVGGAKNVLLGNGLTCIARRQFDRASCHEYQLKGMEHAVTLIQKDLSKHALQLCYKIITADPKKFAKGIPKCTTVVQEDKNHWVERDMQGNVVQVSHKPIKDPITRQARRYARAAIKEFGELPEVAVSKDASQQEFKAKCNDRLGDKLTKSKNNACAGGSPSPPNDPRNNYSKNNHSRPSKAEIDSKKTKVNNMKEFFQTEFGSTLKGKVQKANRTFQGQAIYEVTAKVPHALLKKGDLLYLDALHKDHLEVFSGRGRFKAVLNLDGSLNDKKTNVAQMQNRILR